MKYSKSEFGSDLEKRLQNDNDVKSIARWAYSIYLDPNKEFDIELADIIMHLVVMEEGPEFELNGEEILNIARTLQLGR